MSLDIEETLEVQAPVETVWRFLIAPEKIVTCLPGAELTKIEDERTFLGNMKVKVGPVTVSYQGRVKLTDVDDANHRVKMSGEGTEKGGAGSAKMTMESEVVAIEGGSKITVLSKVDLAGKIVQFGRGMVKGVAQQMFKQFAANLREALKQEPVVEAKPADAVTTTEPATATATATATAATTAATVPNDEDLEIPDRATRPISAVRVTASPTKPLSVPAPRVVEPVRILPIILKVIFEPILRFFRRLFGRKNA